MVVVLCAGLLAPINSIRVEKLQKLYKQSPHDDSLLFALDSSKI